MRANDLDRYITGNWGEDSMPTDNACPTCHGSGLIAEGAEPCVRCGGDGNDRPVPIEAIPVYRYPEEPPEGVPHVYIGKWAWQHSGGGYGMGSQSKIIAVYAIGRTGEVYRQIVQSGSRWDAEATNNLGSKGAVVFTAPDGQAVEKAARECQRRLVTAERTLTGLPTRAGWGTLMSDGWQYVPYDEKRGKVASAFSQYYPTNDMQPFGTVTASQGSFIAEDEHEYTIGRYRTAEEAMSAVERAYKGGL